MGEEGVLAVSSAYAVTFHNVLSTTQRPSNTNASVSDNITFPTSAQARWPVGHAQATKARRVLRLAIIAAGVENSAFMIAKMRDYRLQARRGASEIGNPGTGNRRRGMLFELHVHSPCGPDGFSGAPQEGLRGSEVEGRKSRPVVFGLPSAAALVIAFRVQQRVAPLKTS
jgi:hypothetical protein